MVAHVVAAGVYHENANAELQCRNLDFALAKSGFQRIERACWVGVVVADVKEGRNKSAGVWMNGREHRFHQIDRNGIAIGKHTENLAQIEVAKGCGAANAGRASRECIV